MVRPPMCTTSNFPFSISRVSSGDSNRRRITSIWDALISHLHCCTLCPSNPQLTLRGRLHPPDAARNQRWRPRSGAAPRAAAIRRPTKLPRPVSHNAAPTLTLAPRSASGKEAGRQQRIDKGMLIHTLDLDDLVRAVGYLQETGSVGERRNPLSGVPPRLQQAGAHFKGRTLAGDGLGRFRQRERDRMVRRDAAGRPFLQDVDCERNPVLPDLLEQGKEALLLRMQVLLGVE